MEIEMEMKIGSGLGLAGLVCLTDWTGLDWTGPDSSLAAGLGWDLVTEQPGGLEKTEQHWLARKRNTDSSHRIKMATC